MYRAAGIATARLIRGEWRLRITMHWANGAKERDPNVKTAHQNVSIDPTTQLRNGRKIQHLGDLKQYILTEKKEQYRRAVVSKALAYALGRYLDFRDRPAVDAICNTLEKNEDSFQTLLDRSFCRSL